MKQELTIILLLVACRLQAQQPSDGPYVCYHADKVVVTTIVKDNDLLLPETKRYGSKQAVSLTVVPESRPDWVFTVRLRDTLTDDPANYPATGRCLFMSDIEGEFASFRKMLIAAGVMDTQYRWTYGANTLVIPGDLFDRGRDVVPELWLLYKLEDEARNAGGAVVTILGNHDLFNLSGDHRYTDGKYFKDAWLMKTDINDLFGKDTELGRWLRTKNVIAKVGKVLVMHGGLSPAIAEKRLSVEQLNAVCRPWYDAGKKAVPDSLQLFFGKDALFWYRGYFMPKDKASPAFIDRTLLQFGCKSIVVGHTVVKWNIASYYGGKVIGVDVDEHTREPEAALYENGKWLTVDTSGSTTLLIYKPQNDQIMETDIL